MKGRQGGGFFAKFGIAQPLLTFVVSVISLVIGGSGFALIKFWFYESQAYQPHASINSTLEVRPSRLERQCEATFAVEFENKGLSAFEVGEIRVRVWAFDLKEIGFDKSKATYIGLAQMEGKTPLFDSGKPELQSGFEKSDIPFVRHYAVGDTFYRSFRWFIPSDAGSDFYVRADFNQNAKDEHIRWFTAAWSPSCAVASQAPNTTPAMSPSPSPNTRPAISPLASPSK